MLPWRGRSVRPYVCPSITLAQLAKVVGRNEMPFNLHSRGPNHTVLYTGPELALSEIWKLGEIWKLKLLKPQSNIEYCSH